MHLQINTGLDSVSLSIIMCVCIEGRALGVVGPIRNNFSRPRLPVNLHQGLYLYVLDKLRVDYTLAQGPLRCGAQLGAIGPIGLRSALYVCMYVHTHTHTYIYIYIYIVYLNMHSKILPLTFILASEKHL